MRRLATVVAAVCVGGLALPATASQAHQGHACTLIGCESGVTVDIRPYLDAHPYIRRVVVCVEGRCEVTRWTGRAGRGDFVRIRVAGESERSVAVKVVMYDARGRKRFRKIASAFLRKAQPNGPECEPICFLTSMQVSRRGRLRQTDH